MSSPEKCRGKTQDKEPSSSVLKKSSRIPFWAENPNVLFQQEYILEFFPVDSMTFEQRYFKESNVRPRKSESLKNSIARSFSIIGTDWTEFINRKRNASIAETDEGIEKMFLVATSLTFKPKM
jgi:hypothetical protein